MPTIWNGMLELDPPPDLSSLRELKAGGAAVPESLIRGFAARFGISLVQGWGMTETSPLAATSRTPGDVELTEDEEYSLRAAQGRILPFIDFRIDAESGGELQVRGPWIARAYYEDPDSGEKFTEDGWLRTGDVAELERGCLHPARGPHQGPGQVGRRVDLVGRAGERGDGPPRRGRGRRDRRSR